MLNKKYDFENNNLEEIEEPSIVRITNSQVSISHASGTDVTEIPEDGELIIQIGNIESYNPTPTPAEPEPEITPQPSEGGSGQQGGGSGNGSQELNENNLLGGTNTDTHESSASYVVENNINGIAFVIMNNTGLEARFSGKVILNISKNPTDWQNSIQVYANFHGPQNGTSWDRNDIIIPAGGRWTSDNITSIEPVLPLYHSNINFTDGSWYLMSSDNGKYVHSIYLYTRIYSKSRDEFSGSNHMYVAAPVAYAKLKNGSTYYLNLYWKNPEASLAPDRSGSSYIILENNKTSLD